jgi:hypothetical protein
MDILDEIEVDQLTFKYILSNRRSLSAAIACSFGYICNLFLDPIVSVRLIELGMPEKLTGVAFAIFGLAMILMSPLTGKLC